MIKKIVSIVDYEMGNQRSVYNSITSLGYRARITNDFNELDKSDLIVLPGVGTFCKAMENLKKYNLINYLKGYALDNRPLIGICLGMQLFAENSTEITNSDGLGIIPGIIEPINYPKWHIGWNNIDVSQDSCLEAFNKLEVYYNHSFSYNCSKQFIHATSNIGNENKSIVACVKKNNTIGLQFHPEKSQTVGLSLFENLFSQLL
tara:strand:+ start:3405 stop:4016 length:612 start_codon:yes stop_codon:yes gene_type:complete